QFGIQQWVRVLCDISNINYREYLCEQFSDAFDVYLLLIHRVDQAIKIKLGRHTPNWRILHGCPPCHLTSQLAGEPDLDPSVMGVLDGNNSLKRFVRES
ncbi:hypothetical protein JB92DRAFT_2737443, partial [Gautieria morchelliformis]